MSGTSWFHYVLAVLRKEVVDNLRDRRSVSSALAYALFGPLLVAVMLSSLAKSKDPARQVVLPVDGAEHAPGLVHHLAQQGADIVDAPDDAEAAVAGGSADLVLRIPEGFADDYRALRPATLELIVDSSRGGLRTDSAKVRGWLQSYGAEIGSLRLLARGVDPQISRPFDLDLIDLASEQSRAARLLGSLPIFFLLAAFIGGMNVAIDVTAGERERKSLESLLVHSMPETSLACGKWATSSLFAALSLVVMLAVSVVALGRTDLGSMGAALRFGVPEAAAVLAVVLPLALLAPALQMLLALFAKTFKEAQTYLSLFLFVPMIPGLALVLELFEVEPWMHAVPVLAQQVQILDVMRGDAISSQAFWLGAVTTLAATVALVWFLGRLFGRERFVLAG